jgi:hypothetical protein
MIDLSNFKLNEKYFITIQMPLQTKELKLRILVHELIHEPYLNFLKPNTYIIDHIRFNTSILCKDIIDECGYNFVVVPLPCIKKVESLHDILDKIFIDDIIYLINEYI